MAKPSSSGFAQRLIPWHILLYKIHEVIERPITLVLILDNVDFCVVCLQMSWTRACVTGGKHDISFGTIEEVPVVPFFLRLAGFKIAQGFMSEDLRFQLMPFSPPDTEFYLIVSIICPAIKNHRITALSIGCHVPIRFATTGPFSVSCLAVIHLNLYAVTP